MGCGNIEDKEFGMLGTLQDVRDGKFGFLYGYLKCSEDGNYVRSGEVEVFQYDNKLIVFHKSKRAMLETPAEKTPLSIYNRIYNSLGSDELVTMKDFKEFINLLCNEFECELIPKKSEIKFPIKSVFLGIKQ